MRLRNPETVPGLPDVVYEPKAATSVGSASKAAGTAVERVRVGDDIRVDEDHDVTGRAFHGGTAVHGIAGPPPS